MLRIEFIDIEIQNFRNITERETIEFNNGSLISIIGPNGSGKTSRIEAIVAALFGTTSSGLGFPDLINRKKKKNLNIKVRFRIDKDIYTVDRYYKDKENGNRLILLRNGIDISEQMIRDTIKKIESVLISKRLFLNTIMFGQKVKDFFTNLRDSEQKEIFSNILNLQKFEEWKTKSHSILKETEELLGNSKKENEINTELLADAGMRLVDLKKKEKTFEEDKKERIKKIKEEEGILKFSLDAIDIQDSYTLDKKRNELSDNKSRLEVELEKKREGKKRILAEANSVISEKKNNIEGKASSKINEIRDKQRSKENTIEESRNEKVSELKSSRQKEQSNIDRVLDKISKENDYIAILIENITLYENRLNEEIVLCPTCNSILQDEEKISLIKGNLSSFKESLVEKRHVIKTLEKENSLRSDKIKDADKEILEVTQKYNRLRTEIKNAADQLVDKVITTKNESIQKIKDNMNLQIKDTVDLFDGEISTLEANINEVKTDLSEVRDVILLNIKKEEKRNSLLSKLKVAESRLKIEEESAFNVDDILETEEKISSYKEKDKKLFKEIDDLEKRREIIQFWKSAFSNSGIPSMLIDEAIPFMNSRIRDYLAILSDGRFTISFDTLKETKSGEYRDKIAVNVLDTVAGADKIEMLSGGQHRLIDICTILTLHDLQEQMSGASFNILLFDEIFDALDIENVDRVSRTLKKIAEDKCIVVISHTMSDELDAVSTKTLRLY